MVGRGNSGAPVPVLSPIASHRLLPLLQTRLLTGKASEVFCCFSELIRLSGRSQEYQGRQRRKILELPLASMRC